MGSNRNCKNQTASKSDKKKTKSAFSVAEKADFWSCYPDLNWGPHPYQAALAIFSNYF